MRLRLTWSSKSYGSGNVSWIIFPFLICKGFVQGIVGCAFVERIAGCACLISLLSPLASVNPPLLLSPYLLNGGDQMEANLLKNNITIVRCI